MTDSSPATPPENNSVEGAVGLIESASATGPVFAPPPPLWRRIFWNFDERRLRAGWRLLLQIALAAGILMSYGFGVAPAIGDFLRWLGWPVRTLIYAGIFGGLLIMSVWLAARFLDRRSLSGLGLRIDGRWLADACGGIAIGVAMQAAIVGAAQVLGGLEIQLENFTNQDGLSAPAAALVMAALFVIVGLYEELFSRGYQVTNLVEGFSGPLSPRAAAGLALLITGGMFGLLHLFNPNATALAAASIFAAGLMLGLAYIWTGSLGLAIGVHVGWNYAEGCLFGLPVSGAPASYSLWRCELRGPALWTGGDFGPEGGLGSVAATALGIGLIAGWCRMTRGGVAIRIPHWTRAIDC